MATRIRLVSQHTATNFAPLGVLGYCLRCTDFLAPVFSALELPLKTVRHSPKAKLLDIVVGILSGCRAIEQVNTRIRPDVALAQAWGRDVFAEQSLLADTLNAFEPVTVDQLRQGSDRWFRHNGRLFQHDFAANQLWLDIDLTPLPSSKQAEASTKGKFAKKTAMAAHWHGCMRRSIMRQSSPSCTQASRIAVLFTNPCLRRWRRPSPSPATSGSRPSCAPTLALVVMPTSTTHLPLAGRF
jgi:hypothetical protein